MNGISIDHSNDLLSESNRVDENEADLDLSTSGSESEVESGSDEELGITKDLNSIGRFSNFTLPNFWNNINLYNPKNVKAVEGKVDVQSTISRREQLSNFIDDLKSGFSLQSALDRFQMIRSALETSIDETIENGVDYADDVEHTGQNDDENYEPHVITAAVEPKEIPMLDQVIIPENKDPERHMHKKKKKKTKRPQIQTNSDLENLANMPNDESNDEEFLRKRIRKIRRLSISEQEKNRLTQKLMMGAHYDKIRFVDDNGDEVLQITADRDNSVHNQQGLSHGSDNKDQGQDLESSEDEEMEYDDDMVIVNEEDKEPCYHNEETDTFGCPHYQRNCKMECPRCRKWFGCPICHDEAITGHKFKREQTRHVMCLKCFNVQEPGEFCEECDIQFASYYCSKCKLYDNDDYKDIYHCDDCGICRLGLGLGQDFFHCKGCNACLSIELQDDHRCIERATQSDCPICGEYMFTSVKPVVFMSCGHAIHQTCFEDHSKHSYKCPTCQKTVLNMEAQFRVLDMEISLQPLPQPYCQWTCVVSCNDCNAKSSCAYHVLGLKCDNCKGYNTVQLKLIKPEESDYDSDISTTTNQLRISTNIRNLRNIPISSANLLNTNYNIENYTPSSIDATLLDHNRQVNRTSNDNQEGRPEGEENTGGLNKIKSKKSSSTLKNNDGNGTSTTVDGSSTRPSEGRILTLPRQLLHNFDNYVQNIQDSSEDEDSDEQDFLRVNKSFKNKYFKSDIFSDSTQQDTEEGVGESKNLQEENNNNDNNNNNNNNNTVPSFTNAIREFLTSGSLAAMVNDMNNDSDEEIDDEEDVDSDENINGF